MLQHLSKWVKQTLIILGMLLGLSPIAFAQTNLERGTYTLTNNVAHDNPVGQGMARSYTEEQSGLTVTKDGLWLTLGFNNTQYMGEFIIKVNGSQTSYETVYNSNNIKKLKFKISGLDASVGVSMHVVPMNTDVEYTVTLNEGSLKLIEKEEVEETKPEEPKVEVSKPQEPAAKPENSNGSASNNGDSAQTGNGNNTQNTVKPSVPAAPSTGNPSNNTASNSQSKPQADSGMEEKVEEEVQISDDSTETSETGKENEELAVEAETEELVDKTSEELEVEVLTEQEINEETPQETETISEPKGNGGSMIIIVIGLIVLAAGLYFWYFKMKK